MEEIKKQCNCCEDHSCIDELDPLEMLGLEPVTTEFTRKGYQKYIAIISDGNNMKHKVRVTLEQDGHTVGITPEYIALYLENGTELVGNLSSSQTVHIERYAATETADLFNYISKNKEGKNDSK